MSETVGRLALPREHLHPLLPASLLLALALMVAGLGLAERLPAPLWLKALVAPETGDMRQMLVHYSFLPRLATSLICGGVLAFAGVVFQQVLRNPIASPTTLGVSAGAHVALVAATLWAPALLDSGKQWVALAGGMAAMALVIALSWHKTLSPVATVLAGLIVSFYASAVATALVLFHNDQVTSLFIWSAGSLSQQDWSAPRFLALWTIPVVVATLVILRPLTLLGLGDESSRSLGLSLVWTRLSGLVLAVALTSLVVAAVGIIAFIGLAAPALAGLLGARRLPGRLLVATMLGAALLTIADQAVLALAGAYGELAPTGAMTALLGAPLLLWLLPRLRPDLSVPETHGPVLARRSRRPLVMLAWLGLALAAALAVALAAGRAENGWQWADLAAIEALSPWRAPRTFAALAAGALLSMAGAMVQRLTLNPMASPEILGISSGAAFGVILQALLGSGGGREVQVMSGAAGAVLTFLLILLVSRRGSLAPEKVLLAGVAVAAGFQSIVTILLLSGDPRMAPLLSWIAGSTYEVTATDAWVVGALALFMACGVPLIQRWLDILPLGEVAARSIGLNVAVSRFVVLLVTAVATAAATMVVGPLTFIGLMAPHLARLLGLQRAWAQMLGAALLGAVVMVLADWLGRNLLFPRQIQTGMVATLIGAPFFMWLYRRNAT